MKKNDPLWDVAYAARARDEKSEEFKVAIIKASKAGFSYSEIAKAAGVSKQWVGKIVLESK